jgi:hypothetical protein
VHNANVIFWGAFSSGWAMSALWRRVAPPLRVVLAELRQGLAR